VNEDSDFRLVLGIIQRGGEGSTHQFLPERHAEVFEHQCGGVSCAHQVIHGIALKVRPDKFDGVRKLCERWYGSEEWGGSSLTLDSLLRYRADLKELLGADCNGSFPTFMEAWYPLDPGFAPELSAEPLPEDFDALIDWSRSPDRFCGCLNRWSLVILGENSD
jgi:hypothetical protein